VTGQIAERDVQVIGLLRHLEREGKATTTALVLDDPELSFDSYEALGRFLGTLRDATAWWLGDWLLFGEAAYGEKYAQATEATGRSKSTLQNYLWVAQNVTRSRRRENLSWSHHVEVAKLAPREQDRWLKRCEREGLSVEELRGLVRPPREMSHARPEPVMISARVAKELVDSIEVGLGQDGELDEATIALQRAAKSNGAVAVVVTSGKPCPTCHGTGQLEEEE
jgi:hypothetical protein